MRLNLSKSKVFLWSCILFIIGIAIASFLPTAWLKYDLWFFGVMAGLAVIIILYKIFRRDSALCCPYIFFVIFFILGIWRYAVSLPSDAPDKIWHYNNQNVEFIGVVNREPDARMYNTKLTVGAENLENGVPVRGNVLITTKLYPEYNYGDWLQIQCELEQPEMFNEFAYDRYLARHGVYSLCYYPALTPIPLSQGERGYFTYTAILDLKNKLKDSINYGLLEPEASLLQAIILGNKRGLTPEMINKFSQSGISHIVAISGMHIAIISVIIINVLLAIGLSRKWAFLFSSLSLLVYIILIGLPASAIRAGFMAFLAMLAIYLGRKSKITNSLLLAAVVLLLFNPRLLRDDIGFQLSFLAVLSIVYVKPIIDGWIKKIKFVETHCNASLPKGIIDIITVTLSAQVLTLPIIALNFHQVSIVSPLVNVLVLFLLPFIMVSGILAAVISVIFTELAWLFFAPAYLMLKYLLWIVDFSVKLPLAYLQVEYIWAGWIISFYLLVGYVIFRYNKQC
ncbi:MAG: ComEC/Rec2 family competence protein [Patescibacteria group bacterium]|jgi:competence protein ComEC